MNTNVTKKGPTRYPAVAGSFYPADPQELSKQLDIFLAKTKKHKTKDKPRILIAPHAGIEYSGQTAAWAYKQAEGYNFETVIMLGSNHKAWTDYASVYNKGSWQTPLGKIQVNEKLAKYIIDEKNGIKADQSAHKDDHVLELQLIFAQKVLKNFTILPILIGQVDNQLINRLATKISQIMDDNTLLIVSTDLSHYPSWDLAKKVDKQTIDAILSGKSRGFTRTVNKLEKKAYSNLETCICGYDAVRVALKIAKKLDISDFKKLFYQNSGDISGDKGQVVGYTAIAAWS